MKQLLISIDETINCCIWIKGDGWGTADETLSARAWRLRETSKGATWAVALINTLFRDTNHCRDSYNAELLREHLPKAYRQP